MPRTNVAVPPWARESLQGPGRVPHSLGGLPGAPAPCICSRVFCQAEGTRAEDRCGRPSGGSVVCSPQGMLQECVFLPVFSLPSPGGPLQEAMGRTCSLNSLATLWSVAKHRMKIMLRTIMETQLSYHPVQAGAPACEMSSSSRALRRFRSFLHCAFHHSLAAYTFCSQQYPFTQSSAPHHVSRSLTASRLHQESTSSYPNLSRFL